MKQLFLTLCLLLTGVAGYAQPATWTFALPIADGNGAMDVATDAGGNVYVTGRFTGRMSLGAMQLVSPGLSLYVAKCRPTGEVLPVTQLETTLDVLPLGIAVDQDGNSFVTGIFSGTLSSRNGQSIAQPLGGHSGSFVLKCRADGTVQWLRRAENSSSAARNVGYGASLAVDRAGNCYVTGYVGYVDPNAPPVPGLPERQAFLLSYDPSGTVRWAREWAGTGQGSNSRGLAVAVDDRGQCVVSNEFYLGATLGNVTLRGAPNAYNNTFLAAFNASQGALLWTRMLADNVTATAVATDRQGSVFVGGRFSGTAAFGNTTLAGAGASDGFVARYSPRGTPEWATQVGSPDYDAVSDIAVDRNAGRVYATGIINFASDPVSRHNGFVAELNPAGRLQRTELVAGPGTSSGAALALDDKDNLYLAGIATGSCGFGPFALANPATGAYLARYGSRSLAITKARTAKKPAVSLFPNPSQSRFTLQLGSAPHAVRATLYNQLGQAVAEQVLAPADAPISTLFDTAALPDGLYVLRVASPEGSSAHSVVVRH